ncbi:MAG: hypothetical protein K0R69_2607 [Clostridia bacterium]|nr:hypothetical protein [Clostridia bacterium]
MKTNILCFLITWCLVIPPNFLYASESILQNNILFITPIHLSADTAPFHSNYKKLTSAISILKKQKILTDADVDAIYTYYWKNLKPSYKIEPDKSILLVYELLQNEVISKEQYAKLMELLNLLP